MPVFSIFKNTLFVLLAALMACKGPGSSESPAQTGPSGVLWQGDKAFLSTPGTPQDTAIVVGANRTERYFPKLLGKRFAVVANQTSVIFHKDGGYTHLVDSLAASGLAPLRVFAPEHGFRGKADAGEHVKDGVDKRSGLPVISLYGSNRKPGPEQLEGLDLVLFDIQDVGVRFYTYIATLQLVMEACASAGIPVLVLDRPNPNGGFVDGPVMEKEHSGFLGMTPIPLVYGMTMGEYAEMINGQGWLEGGARAALEVIPLNHYYHGKAYELPIPPSPNLPNQQAVRLYPSLGLFEGTHVNAGRGSLHQFQSFGAPFLDPGHFDFSYTPQPMPGAKNPKHQGVRCYGKDLRQVAPLEAVDLRWLIEAYRYRKADSEFFKTAGFTKHAGTEKLQKQIENGMEADEIRETWQADLTAFRTIRARYLRYP